MYVVGAPYLLFAAVSYYAQFFGPERPGWTVTRSENSSLIQAVQPNSPAARAGLEPGDRLLSWDGLPVAGELLRMRLWHVEIGRSYRLEVQRGAERRTISLSFGRRTWNYWREARGQAELVTLVASTLYLILAFVIAFLRPHDTVARWGALFLAGNVVGANDAVREFMGVGVFHTFRELPAPVGGLVLLTLALVRPTIVSVLLTFLATFPRRLFKARWIWAVIWAPALPSVLTFLYWYWLQIYSPDGFSGLGWTATLSDGMFFAYLLAAPFVLFWNYRQLEDLNERRRVRVVVTGLGISAVAVLSLLIPLYCQIYGWGPLRELAVAFSASPLFIVFSLLYATFPISMAYAILRHRLFDIRVMVRQGLQYAAARGLLLSLVPFVALLLVLDLLLHADQRLSEILSQRGWFYAVLGLGGLLAHLRRKVWLAALDRRFFREHYDAQRVLRGVVEEIRQAGGFEQVAPRAVAQIEAALHPEFAALLLRQPGEASYRVLAAKEKAPPPIPPDSKLMGLVRLLGKPVEISQSETGWLRRQLPHEETEFLRQARLEWLFPISLATNRPEALLALGPKRSEEPYSREDQDLLEGITASLALLLERSPTPAVAREGLEPVPGLLARRYRFQRQLGRGGMGAVYEALDTELERRVAVKLIRSDLLASPEAAVRFKREAKAAASFSHPNVVTIYDFGVAEDQRAYLVMELLHGCTLRQELRQRGHLPAARALEILRGACAAVEAAHRRRLLHRDLKPENIFLAHVEGLETAKVLDFGVVKPIAPGEETLTLGETAPGVLIGTLRYMSPEQLRGEAPAEGWDLWSLAVVAYEMLTGAYPFAGDVPADWQRAVLAGRVSPLRAHLGEAPASWETFFQKALASDRAQRPASASQLFADFQQVVQ
jgi:hypothetical protein